MTDFEKFKKKLRSKEKFDSSLTNKEIIKTKNINILI